MTAELATPSPKYQAFIQLFRTADTLWNASRTFFRPWDISPSQFNVMNLLTGVEHGLSQTQLSEALIVHRSNVTGLVDRLEKRGLVARLEVHGDRRAYRVVLTKAGQQLLTEILPRYYKAAEALWEGVSLNGVRQVVGILERAAANSERIAVEFVQTLSKGAHHAGDTNPKTGQRRRSRRRSATSGADSNKDK